MSDITLGILFAILAGISFGTSPVLARIGLRYINAPTGLLVSMLSSLAIIAAIAIPLHGRDMLELPLHVFPWFVLLGILNYVLGRYLNYVGVHLAGVAKATPLISTSPLFAMILAIIFIQEVPPPIVFVGALSIVGGVALIVSERPS